jgi:hypothetical protein
MKPSPHGEQARLPLAAGRIVRRLLETVTIRESKAGTKVALPGLLSVFDRDKETPVRLIHREF